MNTFSCRINSHLFLITTWEIFSCSPCNYFKLLEKPTFLWYKIKPFRKLPVIRNKIPSCIYFTYKIHFLFDKYSSSFFFLIVWIFLKYYEYWVDSCETNDIITILNVANLSKIKDTRLISKYFFAKNYIVLI